MPLTVTREATILAFVRSSARYHTGQDATTNTDSLLRNLLNHSALAEKEGIKKRLIVSGVERELSGDKP